MRDLCLWMPREVRSVATDRSSGIQSCLDDAIRQNRVLSRFCDVQQKIVEIKRPANEPELLDRRLFRRGLRRNASGLLPLAPHLPLYKTGFWGWREILATSFSGYFFNYRLFFTS